MSLLITEFNSTSSRHAWRDVYQKAREEVEGEVGVRIIDIGEIAPDMAERVALIIQAVAASDVADGSARPYLASAHGRQVLDPRTALAIPALGDGGDAAVVTIREWFSFVPRGADRWVIAVEDDGALHRRVFLWLYTLADRHRSGRSETTVSSVAQDVVRNELPRAEVAANLQRRRIFRGTPG